MLHPLPLTPTKKQGGKPGLSVLISPDRSHTGKIRKGSFESSHDFLGPIDISGYAMCLELVMKLKATFSKIA
jgi:hypothetical protein